MMRFNNEKIKIGLFGLSLAVLFLTSVLHKPKTFSEEENRYLAEFPKIQKETLLDGSFMKDYETYIVDQFPNRSFFTGIKTLFERLRGKKDDNEVYFGKDGYLLGKYATSLFEGEIAKRNEEVLVKFAERMEGEFGKERFQVAMIPSSAEILAEKLPASAPVYDETGFIKRLRERLGEEVTLPTPEILGEHKKEYIYYRTDHHWTTLGAYYTYEEIAKRFEIEPKKLEEFKKEEISDSFLGTYDSKVSTKISGGVLADKMTLYHPFREDKMEMVWDGKEEKKQKGIFVRDFLKGKDKYSVFMGGNHGITEIRTGGKKDRSLLVLKDSFAHSLVPFLLEDYDKVLMLDLRHFNKSLKKFMVENKVTDVLVLYSTANFVTDNNIAKLLR